MSLDKWLKPDKKEEEKPQKQEMLEPTQKRKEPEIQKKPVKMTKFFLTCTKKNCKYQKIKVKKELTKRDKICPKCKGQMKAKNN